MNPSNILFISWDGPQTNYLEGLFLPIFNEIQKRADIQFHILQFTWADESSMNRLKEVAKSLNVVYTHSKIKTKPIASLGKFLTVFSGARVIKDYIEDKKIDIVMPRSTFPAMMVNRLKHIDCKVIFDADGLPLEERVDFAGLNRNSFQYKFLKKEEARLLKSADKVITRSQRSIEIHVRAIGEIHRNKFHVVSNGRCKEHFAFNESKRLEIRENLNLDKNALLWVYCGSLGGQYGWQEMMDIFSGFLKKNPSSKFLILTGNLDFARENLEKHLKAHCVIMKVPFQEVPDYLSAADIAFAIRKPTYSMQGVAPIKLGEYLLMGLPTIASMGIGDTEQILNGLAGTYGFDHKDPLNIEGAVAFASNLKVGITNLRQIGIDYFSLEKSADSYLNAFSGL